MGNVPGLDIANYQGNLLLSQAQCLSVAHDLLMCRASLESKDKQDITRQQLTMGRQAGAETAVYEWAYADWSPEQTAQDTVTLIDGLCSTKIVSIDLEDTESFANYLTPVQSVDWIKRNAAELVTLGMRPVLYTAYWCFLPICGNSTELAFLPLHVASYDGNPDLTTWRRFGGFTVAVGKQWAGNGSGISMCGIVADMDTWDGDFLFPPVPQPPTPTSREAEYLGYLRNTHARAVMLQARLVELRTALDGADAQLVELTADSNV